MCPSFFFIVRTFFMYLFEKFRRDNDQECIHTIHKIINVIKREEHVHRYIIYLRGSLIVSSR